MVVSLVGITIVRLLPFRVCSGLLVCGEKQKPAVSIYKLFAAPSYVSLSLVSLSAPPVSPQQKNLGLFLRIHMCRVREGHMYSSISHAWYIFLLILKFSIFVHSRIAKGTEADMVWRETGDSAMICIAFLAVGCLKKAHTLQWSTSWAYENDHWHRIKKQQQKKAK